MQGHIQMLLIEVLASASLSRLMRTDLTCLKVDDF